MNPATALKLLQNATKSKGIIASLDDQMIALGRGANRARQKVKWAALSPEKLRQKLRKIDEDIAETTKNADLSAEQKKLKIEGLQADRAKAEKALQEQTNRIQFAEKGTVREGGKKEQEAQARKAKAVGYGVAEAGLFALPIAGGLAMSPVRSAREYVTQDNFEEELAQHTFPQKMRASIIASEQARMRQMQENLRRLASANPAIAASLMAGMHLPNNATVIGGQPRTDLMMALGEMMESGQTSLPPDPAMGMF